MNTEYLVIPGWRKMQHYKYRWPPWIKLHFSWLDNTNFRSLTRAEQGDYFKLFLIAAKHKHGHISNDRKYLREVGQIASKSIKKFIKLGLIRVQCDSETIDEDNATDPMTNPELTAAKYPCVAPAKEPITVHCHAEHMQDVHTLLPLRVLVDRDE